MHYSNKIKNPEEILEIALKFFENRGIIKINAFFHYFGMSCYARHGKLHYSIFYIEELLKKYSFNKEHENVYFSKILDKETYYCDPEITFDINENANKLKIVFHNNDAQIGYCDLAILHNNIAYLYYIEIIKEYRNKGWGTKCMNNIFHLLKNRKIVKLDLDTIDSNLIAQKFYAKIGFNNKGITRSYYKEA